VDLVARARQPRGWRELGRAGGSGGDRDELHRESFDREGADRVVDGQLAGELLRDVRRSLVPQMPQRVEPPAVAAVVEQAGREVELEIADAARSGRVRMRLAGRTDDHRGVPARAPSIDIALVERAAEDRGDRRAAMGVARNAESSRIPGVGDTHVGPVILRHGEFAARGECHEFVHDRPTINEVANVQIEVRPCKRSADRRPTLAACAS
jgi:hypothetical protein